MKLKALQNHLRSVNVDVALFFGCPNVWYFSSARVDSGCLAVPAKGKPVLFVPGFDAARVEKLTNVKVERSPENLLSMVHSRFPGKRIGVVQKSASASCIRSVKKKWNASLVDLNDVCAGLRLVKTKEELKRLTRACALTDVLFKEFCNHLPKLKSEVDAAGLLHSLILQCGVRPSFSPIVASGRNASEPHHIPSLNKLSGFTVVDFGVLFKNYCSDMTRTVFVGRPSPLERRIYAKLQSVQKRCVDKAVPGTTLDKIGAFARKTLGGSMTHRVGHSLGVDVHDAQTKPLELHPGMVVTIEPGTYPGKYGVRIEDDVVITKSAPVVLTNSSKDLMAFRRNF